MITAAMLPLTISSPGSFYLTENVNFTPTNTSAITIASSNVTIDLNGFRLNGPGNSGSSGTGISAAANGGFTGITIKNGIISNFRTYGIDLAAGNDWSIVGTNTATTLTDLQVLNNSVGQSTASSFAGARTGNTGIVRDCIFRANVTNGLITGNGMIVTRCLFDSNNRNGIVVFSDCKIYDNEVRTNGSNNGVNDAGIYVFANTNVTARRSVLERNQVSDNPEVGIQVSGNQNTLNNNTCISNGTTTIYNPTNRAGFFIGGNQNVLTGNICITNGQNSSTNDNYFFLSGTNNRYGVLTGISGNGSFQTDQPFANLYY